MNELDKKDLFDWCKIPYQQLETHPGLKVPLRLVKDSSEMSRLVAEELFNDIKKKLADGDKYRAIIPSGPSGWYQPFADLVNNEGLNLKNLVVFHMDDCLDWQGHELPPNNPFNFRTFMEQRFYAPIHENLNVPQENRIWLKPDNISDVRKKIEFAPIDITYGGFGQDGHIAYNQARRNPYISPTVDEMRTSSIRIQENNIDTIIAVAQRNLGTAYQFVPPMSVTLGIKECLSAKRVRIFSDTGSWKQTALRIALFGPVTAEFPITFLQEHPDAQIIATIETASHPFSEHPEWDFGLN